MKKFLKDDIIVVKPKREGDFPIAVVGQLQKDSVKKAVLKTKDGSTLNQVSFRLTLYNQSKALGYIKNKYGYTFRTDGKYATVPCVAYGPTGDYVAALEPGMQVIGAGVARHNKDGDTVYLSGVIEPLQPQGKRGKYFDRICSDAIKHIYSGTGKLPVLICGVPKWNQANTDNVESANISFYKKGEKIKKIASEMGADDPFVNESGTPYVRGAHFMNKYPFTRKEQMLFAGKATVNNFDGKKSLEFILDDSFTLYDHDDNIVVTTAPQAVVVQADESDFVDSTPEAEVAQPQVVSPVEDDVAHDEWDLYY